MGMTISAKLELYNQLICRSMDPADSGVTAPPPVLIANPPPTVPGAPSPRPSPAFVSFEYTALDGDGTYEQDAKEWSKQCHKSKAVSSEVARLVRPSSLFSPSIVELTKCARLLQALILSLIMGILSSLTGGFWGAYSDRKGALVLFVSLSFPSPLPLRPSSTPSRRLFAMHLRLLGFRSKLKLTNDANRS
jgi:hypothetical protein